MKSEGICFYVDFGGYCSILAVALHSLEKHFDGHIHVIHGEQIPTFFRTALRNNKRITYSKVANRAKYPGKTSRAIWFRKVHVHNELPFETAILYDCDHVFTERWDPIAFDIVKDAGLMSFHWDMRARDHARFYRQARAIRRVTGDNKYRDHWGANGGCVGSVRGTTLIADWIDVMDALCRHRESILIPAYDEHALSYIITTNGRQVASGRYSCQWKDPRKQQALAVHMMMGAYRVDKIYRDAFLEAWKDDYMGLQSFGGDYYTYNPDSYYAGTPSVEAARFHASERERIRQNAL